MDFPRRPFTVPTDAPVVVHRHGDRMQRRSIAVLVDETDYPDEKAFRRALAVWRRRIGGWVTRDDAAELLGVGLKRVDQLRRDGLLKSKTIGGVVAIDLGSVQDELSRRESAET